MENEVGYELILAVAAIIIAGGTGLFNYFFTRKQKEHDAYTDYVFDARKKLYEKCEPLLFQYSEHADSAIHAITDLARSAKLGKLRSKEKGLHKSEYSMNSTMYRLLMPHAVFRLLQYQLTNIDLNLDSKIKNQYLIAKALYYTFPGDLTMAQQEPKIEYGNKDTMSNSEITPNSTNFAKQGIYAGVLDKLINTLIQKESGCKKHLLTFGEFEEVMKDQNEVFKVFKNLFYKFHPQSHPVLWRILILQARLYTSFMKINEDNISKINFKIIDEISQMDNKKFDWRQKDQNIGDKEVFDDPMKAVNNFLKDDPYLV